MTPEKPTNPKQKGTPNPYRPATLGSESSSSTKDNNTDAECIRSFLEWLGLDSNSKRLLDDKTKMVPHHDSMIGNTAGSIFPHAVNDKPELRIVAQVPSTEAVYVMCEAIVRLDTRLGNILDFTSGQGK
jgi:hypothetical protein